MLAESEEAGAPGAATGKEQKPVPLVWDRAAWGWQLAPGSGHIQGLRPVGPQVRVRVSLPG